MGISGFAGSILYVDLTKREIRIEELDDQVVYSFLGGYGINTKLLYEMVSPDVDPLSPENVIILGAGPFAGTVIPGSAQLLATTKFPVNGAFATACGGGHFALMLKTSGYDHVVISGKSQEPVYLKIQDDSIQFCDAADLWGLDNYDTVDQLRKIYEPCSVIPIGPAGENLVKISLTFIDKGGSLGAGGLPAVMGSKNLKALVACQGTHGIKVADRPKLIKVVNRLMKRMMRWPGRDFIVQKGIGIQMASWWGTEPSIYDNYTRAHHKTSGGDEFVRVYEQSRKPLSCPSCPFGDKEVVKINQEGSSGFAFYGNEIMPLFGGDFAKSAKYFETINRIGLDMLDFGPIVSLVTHLYKKGIITKQDTGGMEINEEDYDTSLKLMEMIANREGLGDILADGLKGMLQRMGPEIQSYVHHMKGRGIVFDPRIKGLGTMEFTSFTNPRGSHVGSGGSPSYNPGRALEDFIRHGERMGMPPEAFDRVFGPASFNPGRLTRYSEDWCSLFNCLSLCNRAFNNRFYHVNTITELYTATTGIEYGPGDIMKAAERSWNLWRVLCAGAGFDRKDDAPPKIWFVPLKGDKGEEYVMTDYYRKTHLTNEDLNKFLDDYYDERGWDANTGNPTPEKLKELDLEFAI